jgi:RND family efflux transporter MFP subunit
VQGLVKKGSLTSKTGEEAKKRFAASEAEFASAEATVDIAEGRVGEIEAHIEFATLRAPFDGVVALRGVDPGDLVRETADANRAGPLFRVKQVDKLRVVTYLPEREAVHLDVGDAVEITLDAMPGKVFTGKVSRTSGVLDNETRLMRAEVDLPNKEGKLVAGLYGRIKIVLTKSEQTLVLPPDSIRRSEEGAYVFVVQGDGTVKKQAVTTGIDDGVQIEITKGLDGSEQVVGGMIGRLAEGDVVSVIGK